MIALGKHEHYDKSMNQHYNVNATSHKLIYLLNAIDLELCLGMNREP